MGTPTQAYDETGTLIWDCQLDIYGNVEEPKGEKCFIPFRYQGQYEDEETGLYYNFHRYYDPNSGTYISQDPIGLAGGEPNFYAYVEDTNTWVDVFGLQCKQWAKNKKKYWMEKYRNELLNPSGKYSTSNLSKMKKGKAPMIKAEISDSLGNKRILDVPMELHHTSIPQRMGTVKAHENWNLTEATPWGHSGMDPYRNLGNDFKLVKIINGTNSWTP